MTHRAQGTQWTQLRTHRTQGTQLRTHRTQGTQIQRRVPQDATAPYLTQGNFLLMFALPDIVCIQDPPFWRSRLPFFGGFKSFCRPHSLGSKQKVAFYLSSSFLSNATVLPRFFDRPDVAALDLFGVDLFGGSFTQFRILHLYNLWSQCSSVRTVPPDLSFPDDGFPLLVVGNFNIHHLLADPLRSYSRGDLGASFPYFSRAADLGFELLNMPGVFTRFPWNSATRPSVIDLSFSSPLLFPFFALGILPFHRLAQITFLFL